MHDFSVVMTVLIETLWNVKVSADCLYLSAVPVLIETLWNVKEDWNFRVMIPAMVLIETLWNVKSYAYQNFCEMYEGINRNIVECKVFPPYNLNLVGTSINRNIVECKGG